MFEVRIIHSNVYMDVGRPACVMMTMSIAAVFRLCPTRTLFTSVGQYQQRVAHSWTVLVVPHLQFRFTSKILIQTPTICPPAASPTSSCPGPARVACCFWTVAAASITTRTNIKHIHTATDCHSGTLSQTARDNLALF